MPQSAPVSLARQGVPKTFDHKTTLLGTTKRGWLAVPPRRQLNGRRVACSHYDRATCLANTTSRKRLGCTFSISMGTMDAEWSGQARRQAPLYHVAALIVRLARFGRGLGA